jgi:hypothetical protein
VPRRLTIPIADSPLLQIVFTGYFAVTPATVQAGAALTAKIGTDDYGVSGRLGFDALVRWEPTFGLLLELYGSFELHFAGESLCSIDLHVLVEGPTPCWHVAGRACISLFLFDIEFPFDEHWACSTMVGPPAPPDVASRLLDAARDRRSWATALPADAGSLAALRDEVTAEALVLHPLGHVRFSQRVIPLGVPVSRFGPARLTQPTVFAVDVAFAAGIGETAAAAVEEFARADFFELSDDEKLTQPMFEQLMSGMELVPPTPTALTMPHQATAVHYETKWLGEHDPGPRPRRPLSDRLLVSALDHGAVAMSAAHDDRRRFVAESAAGVIQEAAFATVSIDTLSEVDRAATFTEASAAMAGRPEFQIVGVEEVVA